MNELNKEQDLDETKKLHRSHSGFWFGMAILLIVFLVAAFGFYLLQQLRSEQTNLDGEVNKGDMQLIELSKQISGYQSQLAALSNEIASKDARFSKTLADFSQLHSEKLTGTQKQFNEAIQQIQRQLGKTRGDLLVADAEYLLSVASERLHLMGDINTTREALEAADQRLRESGDAGTITVREEIVKEIALLKTVTIPDIVGMYATLQTLQEQVDKLSLLLPYAGKTEKTVAQEKNSSPDNIMPIEALKGMVTIHHSEHAVEKILSEEEARFIREQLKVKLEMVQIALVQHDEPLFQSGLKEAIAWLHEHFLDNDATSAVQSELDKLAGIKINSQFPDISRSLKMLRDISKLRLENDKAQQVDSTKPVATPVTQPVNVDPVAPGTTRKPVEVTPTSPDGDKRLTPGVTEKPVEVVPVAPETTTPADEDAPLTQ